MICMAVFVLLDIDNNDITDLTGINAFHNLDRLYVPYNNIISLNLSSLTLLSSLSVNGNQIQYLDLSQNTELTYLNATNNNLTDIDLSNNTNLETINVKTIFTNELDIDLLIKTLNSLQLR